MFGGFTYRLSDFYSAAVTLFAVLNGDVFRETFLNLSQSMEERSWVFIASSQLNLASCTVIFM